MKMKRHLNEEDFGKDFGRAIAKKLLVRSVGKKIFDIADHVDMWVLEGASVLVKKSLSLLHSEYALPLRNKAYNNSASLQEPPYSKFTGQYTRYHWSPSQDSRIETEGVDQVGHSWLSGCASYGGSES